jgi:hypothetical protein
LHVDDLVTVDRLVEALVGLGDAANTVVSGTTIYSVA